MKSKHKEKQIKILVLDNYDSFTYNLVHAIRQLGYDDVVVFRNDKIEVSDIALYDKILISPGPGLPSESGILMDLLKEYMAKKSILGVCLGHQAIGEACGGSLKQLDKVFHGHTSPISITHNDYLFEGIDRDITVGRYHSWVIDRLADSLEVIARDHQGEIMAIRHREYDVRGVQFHPESIMTKTGNAMLENWLSN